MDNNSDCQFGRYNLHNNGEFFFFLWNSDKNFFFKYMYIYIYICLYIHGTHVTANNSTANNVVFFVSDLKIVYLNNY